MTVKPMPRTPGTSVIRIAADLERRLAFLAAHTGRSKSYYASKAIEAYLEERETLHLRVAELEKGPKRQSLESMRKQLASHPLFQGKDK